MHNPLPIISFDDFNLNPRNRKHHHTPGMLFDLLKIAFDYEGDEWEGYQEVLKYVTNIPMQPKDPNVPFQILDDWCRDHMVDFIYEWIILGPYDHESWFNKEKRTRCPYRCWEILEKIGFRKKGSKYKKEQPYKKENLSNAFREFGFVGPKPTLKEVRLRYLEFAKKYHPDVNGGDQKKFIKLKENYDILCEELRYEEETPA